MSTQPMPPGHNYWVHYIAYIGPENEAYEAAIGMNRKASISAFENVVAMQNDLQGIVRANSKIPDGVPVTVVVLGWTKLEEPNLIQRVH